MPLDTQPLSPARRVLMAGILIAVLGLSLALAQEICSTRKETLQSSASLAFLAPRGFSETDEFDALPGLKAAGLKVAVEGKVHNRKRDVLWFSFDGEYEADSQTLQAQALALAEAVLGRTEGLENIHAMDSQMSGIPSVYLQTQTAAGNDQQFVMIEIAQTLNKVVAICYSGPGPITDPEDTDYFQQLVSHSVKISGGNGSNQGAAQ